MLQQVWEELTTGLLTARVSYGSADRYFSATGCSTYATDQFPLNAEPIPACRADLDRAVHISTAMLSDAAAEHGIYLIGGT